MPEETIRDTTYYPTPPPPPRSAMETGSPEFAEDRTQINSLNNKRIHEEYQDLALTAARRGQTNFDNLQQISLRALNNSVDLQAQINERALKSMDQTTIELSHVNAMRARHSDMWAYEEAYDLGNPTTTGVGDNIRAGAAPANRITDTTGAVAGGSVDVAAAGVATANLAALQQIIVGLGQTLQSIQALIPVLVTASGGASTPSQTTAKTGA